jgi:hypothetical protein
MIDTIPLWATTQQDQKDDATSHSCARATNGKEWMPKDIPSMMLTSAITSMHGR